jgi:hypothetical protein
MAILGRTGPAQDLLRRTHREAIDGFMELPSLEGEAARALINCDRIAERIAAMPPKSIEEAAMKLEVLLDLHGDAGDRIDNVQPFVAFRDELWRLASRR